MKTLVNSLIVLFIYVVSCSSETRLQANQKLVEDIITKIVRDYRKFTPPPPPEGFRTPPKTTEGNVRNESLPKLLVYLSPDPLPLFSVKYSDLTLKSGYEFVNEDSQTLVPLFSTTLHHFENDNFQIKIEKRDENQLKSFDVSVTFSNIIIDNSNKRGFVVANVIRKGKRNFNQFLIFLKKSHNNWIVDRTLLYTPN